HRQSPPQVQLPQPRQVAELPVPVLVMGPRLVLATGPQREVPVVQQPSDGRRGGLEPPTFEALSERAERAVRPLHAGDGIPCGGVLQQLLQGPQDSGDRTSTRLGPAPARRTRPAGSVSAASNSRRPRAIVLRSRPVMRSRRAIPPWPCRRARKPATSRRLRS